MDRDPDIRALVEDSDAKAKSERTMRYGMIAMFAILIGVLIAGYISSSIKETKQAKAELAAVKKAGEIERAALVSKLNEALYAITQGDPGPLRQFAHEYGDADANQQASILARPLPVKDGPSSTKIVQDLQSAVDALKQGDAEPVIKLSREIAAPVGNSALTDIEQAAKTPQQANLAATKAQPPALNAPSTPDALSCEGWLWLGSDQGRKVTGDGALSALKPGDRVKVVAGDALRLRTEMPKDDYSMNDAIGLVPVSSEIVIASAPRGYPRPNGLTQYWAKVTTARPFCTRVFLQYVGGDLAALGKIRDAMILKGDVVPPPEQIDTAKGKAEVRYYHDEDTSAAKNIAAALSQLAAGRPVAAQRINGNASSGTVEIWIDLAFVH